MRKARGSELWAVVAVASLFVGLVQAAPVIDDVALEAKFNEGLQRGSAGSRKEFRRTDRS